MKMKVKKHAWFGSAGFVAKTRPSLGVLGTWLAPGLAWANTDAAGTASTGPDLSGVGRVLGMMLFAYLALKWFNRKKDRDDDAPRGFLGLPVKPWVVWLVVIGGLALLMARSG
jgi:hypothetical protein